MRWRDGGQNKDRWERGEDEACTRVRPSGGRNIHTSTCVSVQDLEGPGGTRTHTGEQIPCGAPH